MRRNKVNGQLCNETVSFSTSLLGKRQNLSSADLQPIGSLINGHMTERYCALKVN